jgi:heme-degrading monooxygenase HmoA
MKDKDHYTLKSLWKDLDAALKWAKIKAVRLVEISATRIQFSFIS